MKYLFSLYQGENLGEEKSVLGEVDREKIPVTGNSRFGCWCCTMVKEDKSLQNFINKGATELIPLREFRNELLRMRENSQYRDSKRRNGSVYKKSDGSFGMGPFTLEARCLILEKLLDLENRTGMELITEAELKAIDKMWDEEGDLTCRALVETYHMNTAHIHNHIIMNSVNFENGQKFHQSAREMQQAKEYSNQLCREYGLSFTESKADPFRIPAWKKRLCRTIKEAMENCATHEEFIAFMAEYGYKVRWEPNQKYITYTTPENVRCRDNKLFDQTLLRSSMEAYFDMGGCEYLESRIDATEYGELLPTVDDAVCGLISILDALNTGDNDRFHLETLHHSKQEILRILERGGKIDRTVEYAVDDEDEEYEQYHGFSMRM